MTLQDIRRHFETPVITTCTALGISYRPANTLEPSGDAYSEFVEARLQFGQMMEGIVGDRTKLEHTREDAIAVAHRYDRYVSQGPSIAGWARDNPWQVLGVAFCAGLIIGARPFQ